MTREDSLPTPHVSVSEDSDFEGVFIYWFLLQHQY